MLPVAQPSLELRGRKRVSSPAAPSSQADSVVTGLSIPDGPCLTPRRVLSQVNNPYDHNILFLQGRNVQRILGRVDNCPPLGQA